MRKIWVNKAQSFKEAEEFDHRYYRAMPRSQRLETIQWLRDLYWDKIVPRRNGKGRKGLRRVITIVQ